METPICDQGRHVGSKAAARIIFVNDNESTRFLDGVQDRFLVQRVLSSSDLLLPH